MNRDLCTDQQAISICYLKCAAELNTILLYVMAAGGKLCVQAFNA